MLQVFQPSVIHAQTKTLRAILENNNSLIKTCKNPTLPFLFRVFIAFHKPAHTLASSPLQLAHFIYSVQIYKSNEKNPEHKTVLEKKNEKGWSGRKAWGNKIFYSQKTPPNPPEKSSEPSSHLFPCQFPEDSYSPVPHPKPHGPSGCFSTPPAPKSGSFSQPLLLFPLQSLFILPHHYLFVDICWHCWETCNFSLFLVQFLKPQTRPSYWN